MRRGGVRRRLRHSRACSTRRASCLRPGQRRDPASSVRIRRAYWGRPPREGRRRRRDRRSCAARSSPPARRRLRARARARPGMPAGRRCAASARSGSGTSRRRRGAARPRCGPRTRRPAEVRREGRRLARLEQVEAHVGLREVEARRLVRLEERQRARRLRERHAGELDAHVARARDRIGAVVRAARMAEHRLVLLEDAPRRAAAGAVTWPGAAGDGCPVRLGERRRGRRRPAGTRRRAVRRRAARAARRSRVGDRPAARARARGRARSRARAQAGPRHRW